MKELTTIELEISKNVATVWLNRPDVHNAFNINMINELTKCYEYLDQLKDIRVILIRGKGKSFCSGADLKWMRHSGNDTYQANLGSSLEMANCFHTIYRTSRPTIAIVHGAVYGGANGLMCACDIAIATDNARFSFPELRVGLVPSTILSYVLTRMNQHKAKLLMYSGRTISGREALEIGLIDYLFHENEIEEKIKMIINDLLKSSPNAIIECKSLIDDFSNKSIEKEMISATAESITKMKMSEDSREGMSAFFEKRAPKWVNDIG